MMPTFASAGPKNRAPGELVARLDHLFESLLHHADAIHRVDRDVAPFVVLIARDLSPDARGPGRSIRALAGLREAVRLVLGELGGGVARQSLAPSHVDPGDVEPGTAGRVLRESLIEEENDREPPSFGEVQGLDGHLEAVDRGPGGEDESRVLPVAKVREVREVGLLVPRRLAGRRPDPRAVRDHDRKLRRAGVSDPFGHQREAGPAGRGHDPRTGVSRPDDHVHRGQLVLGLAHDPVEGGKYR